MSCNHLKALELAKAGKWDESHDMVKSYSDHLSCLIHGYLHRVEGDLSNAKYWYNRATEEVPNNTLDNELKRLYQLVQSH